MRKIEAIGKVDDQGNLIIPMPKDIPPGEYHVVVVLDIPDQPTEKAEEPEESERLKTWPPPGFHVFEFNTSGPAPSLRREDLYDVDRGLKGSDFSD